MKVSQEEIDKQPDNPFLHVFLSRIYQQLMEYPKAISCIKEAMRLDKQHGERYRSAFDELIKNLSIYEKKLIESINTHIKNKRCLDAIHSSEKLLEITPEKKPIKQSL